MKIEVQLTGLNTGKTAVICGKHFKNGKLTIEGNNEQVGFQLRYVERTCEAYPVGSSELEEAIERDRKRGFLGTTETSGEQRNPEALRGGVDGPAGPVQPLPANAGSGVPDANASDGQAGLVPGGSGHPDSGLSAEQISALSDAILALDPAVDSNWSEDGLPSVEAVAAVLSDPSVSRAAIQAVEPEFNREVARDARTPDI